MSACRRFWLRLAQSQCPNRHGGKVSRPGAFQSPASLAPAPLYGWHKTFAPCSRVAHLSKRPNPRSVKAVRTYTIPEAALALGVTDGTVRAWIKQGLRAMTTYRPCVSLGDDMREFLAKKMAKAKNPISLDQIYCLSCKAPQRPFGMMLDFIPISASTGRLAGLCEACGGACNRMVSRASLVSLAKILDIACREPN